MKEPAEARVEPLTWEYSSQQETDGDSGHQSRCTLRTAGDSGPEVRVPERTNWVHVHVCVGTYRVQGMQ